MKLRPSRAIFCLVLVLMVSTVLGGLFGGQVRATTTKGEDDVDNSLKLFSNLLGLVEENYATDVDSDKAVYGAIDGMLRTLDPHSKFFDPKAFSSLREDQRGKYYGLGITVTTRFGKVTVVSPPFLGSPAEKVGLRVGDVISHVNGEATQGMELNEVVSKLKGPRGTPVKIRIVRPGTEEPIEMSVIRDEIAKFTISNAFVLRPRVGYIKLDSFAETTGAELRDALRKLDYKNLDGLVFDLRNNPGGLLQEAIEVCETFLDKGQMIVETRGRTRGSNKPYASQKLNVDNHFPLVVLINAQSASASEIVAGAIQDHDRGLIVGQTSFGKGLVQSVYPLSKNAGLALTTQKWYTPSGRLIQRDYSQISQFDYYNHREATPTKHDDIKHSDIGRVVYGGGGITPDYMVEEPKSNSFQTLMVGHFAFYTFVRDFLAKNPPVELSFQASDALLGEFQQHLTKRGIQFAEKDFQDNKDYLKRLIRYEVVYNRFGVSEAARVLLDGDPQVLKAIDLIPEAKDLASKARRQIAERK
ncbi:MAG: S41 family peptidase [Acidobacteria bacterium]|nr:MAG: S41 family peptidase [Acidobacteriota bacterium]